MAVVAQYVVKPIPGSDLTEILVMTKEFAGFWQYLHGNVRLWSPSVGEVGNLVLAVGFPTFAAYGAAVDKLLGDQEFQAWQKKRLKTGATEWVRTGVSVEIDLA